MEGAGADVDVAGVGHVAEVPGLARDAGVQHAPEVDRIVSVVAEVGGSGTAATDRDAGADGQRRASRLAIQPGRGVAGENEVAGTAQRLGADVADVATGIERHGRRIRGRGVGRQRQAVREIGQPRDREVGRQRDVVQRRTRRRHERERAVRGERIATPDDLGGPTRDYEAGETDCRQVGAGLIQGHHAGQVHRSARLHDVAENAGVEGVAEVEHAAARNGDSLAARCRVAPRTNPRGGIQMNRAGADVDVAGVGHVAEVPGLAGDTGVQHALEIDRFVAVVAEVDASGTAAADRDARPDRQRRPAGLAVQPGRRRAAEDQAAGTAQRLGAVVADVAAIAEGHRRRIQRRGIGRQRQAVREIGQPRNREVGGQRNVVQRTARNGRQREAAV